MDKEDLKKVLDYAMAVSFLLDNVECLIEEYRYNEELTDKELAYTEKRIEIVKKYEKDIKNLLGIKE
jgi:hypothetical protein